MEGWDDVRNRVSYRNLLWLKFREMESKRDSFLICKNVCTVLRETKFVSLANFFELSLEVRFAKQNS